MDRICGFGRLVYPVSQHSSQDAGDAISPMGPCHGLAIVTVASVVRGEESLPRDRFVSSFSLERNADRLLIWQAAIEISSTRPLTGVGGGVFPLVYEEYRVEGEER